MVVSEIPKKVVSMGLMSESLLGLRMEPQLGRYRGASLAKDNSNVMIRFVCNISAFANNCKQPILTPIHGEVLNCAEEKWFY